MAIASIQNIVINSIVSCVPHRKKDNLDDVHIGAQQGKKILDATGIRFRRIVGKETTSDLCLKAANSLFNDTGASKDDVAILIFVTQTPDYILPATSMILQDKLGLSQSTMAFDIGMGCSGYVYGLSVIGSLLEKMPNENATALLLVGDTVSKICNTKDMSTYPLFGDAGSATLLEKKLGSNIIFDLHSDGKGAKSIIIEDGGFRNPYSKNSEIVNEFEGNINRSNKDLYLNGMDVFSFGITKIPRAIKSFYEETAIKDASVDYFIFHQANMFMNEKIRKKLKLPEEKVPYSLYEYANVSSATIPLTITSKLKDKIDKEKNILACGFGVGLSWGTVNFSIFENTFLNTIEL
jgi:3-oxoacyl-[acyl-carrier-protein] synthase-3